MNATNRALNRGLLLVVGVVLATAGAALILTASRSAWLGRAGDALPSVEALAEPTITLAEGVRIPLVLVVAGGAAVVLVIALGAFIATRGGGRTATVVNVDNGLVSVDRSVADAVLAGALRERADVLGVRTRSYLVKASPMIALRIRARRGADLPRILRAAEAAVAEWDALAGREVPVMVHIADRRWVDAWRASTRVRESTNRPAEDGGRNRVPEEALRRAGRDIERERNER